MYGKIFIVGIGPGSREQMSIKAIEAIENADIVVGYKTYINLIKDVLKIKKFHSSGMKREVERCNEVIELSKTGKKVALVSSGDPGIYGMAGIMLEIIEKEKLDVEVEVIPGITSCSASASILGAPIMHDFAVVSLSDLLTDWELIKKRIECASIADFVICIYNPKSKTRVNQIVEAKEIMLKHKDGKTPVGIVRNAMREEEESIITNLNDMLNHDIDMTTTIIVGNSSSYVANGKIITPRGYEV